MGVSDVANRNDVPTIVNSVPREVAEFPPPMMSPCDLWLTRSRLRVDRKRAAAHVLPAGGSAGSEPTQQGDEMAPSIFWRILRYVFAAYYLYVGVYLALSLTGVLPPLHLKLSSASASFQHALAETGFVRSVLAATYVVSAGALCFDRTAPLGVVLLAPSMVIIFLTDTLLDTAWVWGTLHSAILAALAWHYRSAYRPMWNYGVPSASGLGDDP